MNAPPMSPDDTRHLRIIVGVDGSASAHAALNWASGFAGPGDEVHVVACERPRADSDALRRDWELDGRAGRPVHLDVYEAAAEEVPMSRWGPGRTCW